MTKEGPTTVQALLSAWLDSLSECPPTQEALGELEERVAAALRKERRAALVEARNRSCRGCRESFPETTIGSRILHTWPEGQTYACHARAIREMLEGEKNDG